jgi:hypothetical protein
MKLENQVTSLEMSKKKKRRCEFPKPEEFEVGDTFSGSAILCLNSGRHRKAVVIVHGKKIS